MLLTPTDTLFGGPLADTDRRDTLEGAGGDDTFVLANDGKTDTILNFEDGSDAIDISAWDASFDQLNIKRISLTEYRVTYLSEETLIVNFAQPAPADIPASGVLLTEDDFIFRPGLPAAREQLIIEASTTANEVLFGTTSPDIFQFEDDGHRDTIRRFEPGKDVVDLADYGTNFQDLRITEQKVGRVTIAIPGMEGRDKLVIIDLSKELRATDITADFFEF